MTEKNEKKTYRFSEYEDFAASVNEEEWDALAKREVKDSKTNNYLSGYNGNKQENKVETPKIGYFDDKGKTTTSNVTSSHSTTTGYSGSTYQGGTTYNYQSNFASHMKPTMAFQTDDFIFIGSAKSNLESYQYFMETDLIVNLTGTEIFFKKKPFLMKAPEWLGLQDATKTITPDQVLLDWPDMSTPPSNIGYDFWKSLLDRAKEFGKRRIFICCTAGQGRTGTALASFLLVTECVDTGKDAIDFIRVSYSKHAIERKCQEDYISELMLEQSEKATSVEDPELMLGISPSLITEVWFSQV